MTNLRVVLVSPRNPLNIGAVARAMQNFGCTSLRVVNAYDVAFREARSAVSAADVLASAEEFQSVGDAVADCHLVAGTTSLGHRELQQPLQLLPHGAPKLRRAMAAGPVALLFGSEKFGLSNDDMAHCHLLLRIPTVDQQKSMNLGQAVAICLYELARVPHKAAAASPKELTAATAADNEQITNRLLEVLRRSGYVNLTVANSTENKIRRMVRRLGLSALDARLWLGMLRQILWKVGPDEHA